MNFDKMPSSEESGEEKLEESDLEEEQNLTPALQEVMNMELNFSDDEYEKKARGGEQIDSRQVSEDALIKIITKLAEGGRATMNKWSAMLNIIDRESMQGHPKMEVFKQAIQDLAEKRNQKLNLPEDYWENLK